jgi:hypothetical protein
VINGVSLELEPGELMRSPTEANYEPGRIVITGITEPWPEGSALRTAVRVLAVVGVGPCLGAALMIGGAWRLRRKRRRPEARSHVIDVNVTYSEYRALPSQSTRQHDREPSKARQENPRRLVTRVRTKGDERTLAGAMSGSNQRAVVASRGARECEERGWSRRRDGVRERVDPGGLWAVDGGS